MSDLTSLKGCADAVEDVVRRVVAIAETVEPAIKKRLDAAPDVVRQDATLFDEYRRSVRQEVRTAALTAADELTKKEEFHPRIISFRAQENMEKWTLERCLQRVPPKSDDPRPESLVALMSRATGSELVGMLDDAIREDRGAKALLIHREIVARAAHPDATDTDRDAAKRSPALLARLSVPEFHQAQGYLKRIGAAELWLKAHRADIKGEASHVFKLQAHRRAA